MRCCAGLLLVCLVVAASGCSQDFARPEDFARPNWLDPGNTQRQQVRAERFDPYPEVDAGPEVVGGRPRDYQVPKAEPARAQQWDSPFGKYGQ